MLGRLTDYFPDPLITQNLGNRRNIIHDTFSYRLTPKELIIVKPGFVTDFASVPRIIWPLYPPDSAKYINAAVIHDAMYAAELFERSKCDSIFCEAMKREGCGWFDRNTIWGSVRTGGYFVWKGHTKESVASARKLVEYVRA